MCLISTHQMTKGKILTWGIIIAVIVSISILAITQNYQKSIPPAISDNPETDDAVNVNLDSNADSPTISDSSPQQEQNFWIDENGTRHYTIEATDSPQLED
jgi:glucan-binding YG repeat protein